MTLELRHVGFYEDPMTFNRIVVAVTAIVSESFSLYMTKTTKQEKCKQNSFGGVRKIDASPEEIARSLVMPGTLEKRRKAQQRKET